MSYDLTIPLHIAATKMSLPKEKGVTLVPFNKIISPDYKVDKIPNDEYVAVSLLLLDLWHWSNVKWQESIRDKIYIAIPDGIAKYGNIPLAIGVASHLFHKKAKTQDVVILIFSVPLCRPVLQHYKRDPDDSFSLVGERESDSNISPDYITIDTYYPERTRNREDLIHCTSMDISTFLGEECLDQKSKVYIAITGLIRDHWNCIANKNKLQDDIKRLYTNITNITYINGKAGFISPEEELDFQKIGTQYNNSKLNISGTIGIRGDYCYFSLMDLENKNNMLVHRIGHFNPILSARSWPALMGYEDSRFMENFIDTTHDYSSIIILFHYGVNFPYKDTEEDILIIEESKSGELEVPGIDDFSSRRGSSPGRDDSVRSNRSLSPQSRFLLPTCSPNKRTPRRKKSFFPSCRSPPDLSV